MPLLKKRPFEKTPLPDGLRDDEEIFYCEFTDEVFRDYEDYSERMFLYNSMVWTCSMTGKSNLTYQEALDSEENAKQCLKEFSMDLRIPTLFLASKTQRSGFADMVEDVFMFMKDRYFIGENLETSFTGNKWKESHVLQVIPPARPGSPPKNGAKIDRHFWPPADMFKYEIEHLEDDDISEIMIVDCNQIRRKKAGFTREKCKLFLKQYVEQDSKTGLYAIKNSALEDFGINKMKFTQIFNGAMPVFEVSKKSAVVKKQKQETLAKFLTKNNKKTDPLETEKKNNLLQQMKKREEEFKLQKQQQLEKKRQIAKEVKQQAKLERNKISNDIKEWAKVREDLLLEDQKKLPDFTPVKSVIPEEYFDQVIMIIDFAETFSKILSTKEYFPAGLSLEIMERVLSEKDVAGPLSELIQMFLNALFNLQAEEAKKYKTTTEHIKEIKEEDMNDNISLTEATRLATIASKWSKKYQGLPLSELALYSVTTSEILRLHLLSSGARIYDNGARWRFAQRGGYTSEDDPGLHLRLYEPLILKALAVKNIVQLSVDEKLKILNCLMNQVLTYADVRDTIEENLEQVRQLRQDLKNIEMADKKLEQTYMTNKSKLRKEKDQQNTAAELDKLEKQYEREHQENVYKINQCYKNIYNLQSVIGTDRGNRRYFRSNAVPALFIQTDCKFGECLKEVTKQYPALIDADESRLQEHFQKIYRSQNPSAIEENEVKMNGTVDHDAEDEWFTCAELHMCSADPETCVVHGMKLKEPRWLFLHSTDQLDALENSLNQRGLRESELLQMLQTNKKALQNIIMQTPASLLNPDVSMSDQAQNRHTKYKKDVKLSNLGFPEDMPPEEVLENSLIDMILEMERKIFCGDIGALPVKDRDKWRDNLHSKNYDLLEKFVKKDKERLSLLKQKNGNDSRASTPEASIKNELDNYTDPGRFLGNTDEGLKNQSEKQQKIISSLAMALSQVAYSVGRRFLKKPLGNMHRPRIQEHELLEKWVQSLLSSTSYSQVFLHYTTLDNCIMWSRSSLKTRCRSCNKGRDPENLILCDSCNLGTHLYCLVPKLTKVPEGEWFCKLCLKKMEKEKEKEESEDEELLKNKVEDDENRLCCVCSSGGELFRCDKCDSDYHIVCCDPPLRRPPRGSWLCHSCKNSAEMKKRRHSDSSDEVVQSKRSYRSEHMPLNNAALQELLSDVIKHDDAWPFVKRVLKHEVPDYYDVITKPMDFGTIKYKLNMGEYTEDNQVMEDIILIFENCNTYNSSDDEVYKCGDRLRLFVVEKAKELGLEVPSELEQNEDHTPSESGSD